MHCLPLGEKLRAVNMMKYTPQKEGKKEVKTLETEQGGKKIVGYRARETG